MHNITNTIITNTIITNTIITNIIIINITIITNIITSVSMPRSLVVGVLVAIPSGAGVALSVLGGNAGTDISRYI